MLEFLRNDEDLSGMSSAFADLGQIVDTAKLDADNGVICYLKDGKKVVDLKKNEKNQSNPKEDKEKLESDDNAKAKNPAYEKTVDDLFKQAFDLLDARSK